MASRGGEGEKKNARYKAFHSQDIIWVGNQIRKGIAPFLCIYLTTARGWRKVSKKYLVDIKKI